MISVGFFNHRKPSSTVLPHGRTGWYEGICGCCQKRLNSTVIILIPLGFPSQDSELEEKKESKEYLKKNIKMSNQLPSAKSQVR
jgi:hypothetical protein